MERSTAALMLGGWIASGCGQPSDEGDDTGTEGPADTADTSASDHADDTRATGDTAPIDTGSLVFDPVGTWALSAQVRPKGTGYGTTYQQTGYTTVAYDGETVLDVRADGTASSTPTSTTQGATLNGTWTLGDETLALAFGLYTWDCTASAPYDELTCDVLFLVYDAPIPAGQLVFERDE